MTAAAAVEPIEGAALDFLLQLLDTPAPSGFEGPAAELWQAYASSHTEVGEVAGDALGNSFARVNPDAPRGPIMLAGHLDEIGFIINGHNEHGQLSFEGIGGWDATVPVGQRVRVLTESGVRIGTVGRLAPHKLADRGGSGLKLADLWIDVGAVDRDEALQLVRPGDPVVLDTRPHLYDNRRVLSRSADDRVGAFIAIETARRCAGLDVQVVAVGTTTEENAQVGAMSIATAIAPAEACIIEVTFTSDTPGDHDEDVTVGGGPVVSFGAAARSAGGNSLVRAARELDMPVQLSSGGSYTSTDADDIIGTRGGVPCSIVSVPTRYLHSPGELFDLADVERTIALLVQWIRSGGSVTAP